MKNAGKFKARPLDRRIFENSGLLGIHTIEKAPLTVPEEFSFATDSRLRSKQDDSETVVEQSQKRYKAVLDNGTNTSISVSLLRFSTSIFLTYSR
jgi:targeting protein for Xklp2